MSAAFNQVSAAAVLCAALFTGACQEQGPLDTTSALAVDAVRYEMVAGDAQSARPGTELAEPLVVRVTDGTGIPRVGQIVNWVVTEGGGHVFAGRALTDSLGYAREWWTLGPEPGRNVLEARAVDSSTGEPLVFGRFAATASDSVAPEPTPTAPSIAIAGAAYKVKGMQKVDLAWGGATGEAVRILRNDRELLTTANDGGHLDAIDRRGGGSYRYRVCEVGGSRCSAELQVAF